ncbi:CD248 molecule, endosialin a [Cololabis saira]|uniref:CD248 molecule, endosialin a n=1 Tax=Cololabis saira TaxID=129043 RepID=UPI002AD1DEA0|nr:CD248 molecule, endosialin a [Cololabis saira]
MVFQVRSPAARLLLFVFGVSCILGQDLRETDALCNADGCFVVYFQRRIFLDSWRACKEKGGNLATIKRKEDADAIAALFSAVDLPDSSTTVQVWIGLQRQPRHCSAKHPLRGFSWTTGDQDTQYTNWRGEDSLRMCSVPRCVAMSYSSQEQSDNFTWLDGACSVPVDGYLCHYSYKGMCSALWSEGAGNALYKTPFNLLSTILTHIPLGSDATVPCPSGDEQEKSAQCMLRADGTVGWSPEPPLCLDPSVTHNLCGRDNGGCQHYCRSTGGHVFCECAEGYRLGDDRQTCELTDVCHGAPCQFECLRFQESYRCACPEGYMLAPDESTCLDVDECLQSPCEQLCENFPGTFECRCREGYFPDDAGGCEDVDECMDNPCEHACENTPGSHVCHCHLGFSPVPGEPSQCQDVDECQIRDSCEQMCVNYDGGFGCYCKEGYELMSDQYSCQEIAAAFTHNPEPEWDPSNYNWNPEQSHVSWPKESDQRPDWLTNPPKVSVSDVIWVTRAPQDELYFDPELDLQTQGDDRGAKEPDWSSDPDFHVLPITIYDKLLPTTTSSSTTPVWYEDDEETTSAPPFHPTSTTSEGAWNWWPGPLTSTRSLTSNPNPRPEDSIPDDDPSTESEHEKLPEEEETLRGEIPQVPVEDSGNVDTTRFQGPAAPTHFTTPQPPLAEGGRSGDGQDDREQSQGSTWLLVGLLVPICIFIVVMVALGIVYCTRCAVQPKNRKTTECYHWISGAHDKPGAPNAAAGVKSQV